MKWVVGAVVAGTVLLAVQYTRLTDTVAVIFCVLFGAAQTVWLLVRSIRLDREAARR